MNTGIYIRIWTLKMIRMWIQLSEDYMDPNLDNENLDIENDPDVDPAV